jgi:erythronate-4-phosphate dehydrogenase
MKIVADRAIPFVAQYFAGFGVLDAVDARAIDRKRVRDADLLVVRTVTRVDERLLAGSSVRFVASATSGIDHVDTAFLGAAGIGFAEAPGCNATAVAEYVLSSLFALSEARGFGLAGLRVGIVGCGHVGSRLVAFLDALGIEHLDCDPPLQRGGRDGNWRDLADLRAADVISLHVSLTNAGPHATRGMIGAQFLSGLRDNVVLVNAARGGIVDERALLHFLVERRAAACILDTWTGEPDINIELLQRADIGTPHVAGYSLDARLRATAMVARAAGDYLGIEAQAGEPALPVPEAGEIRIAAGTGDLDAVRTAVLSCYDVRNDAARLRRMLELDPVDRAAFFADLRNNYPVRREFRAYTVRVPPGTGRLERMLGGIGFRTAQSV